MAELLYPLALLACPLGMGAMMWMMMRGSKSTGTVAAGSTSSSADELTRLRAEVDQLRAGQQRGESGNYATGAGSVDRG